MRNLASKSSETTNQETTSSDFSQETDNESLAAPFRTITRKFVPPNITPKNIISLQHTIGNQAVMRLLKNNAMNQASRSRFLIASPVIQRTRAIMKDAELTLKINVSESLLDEGSKLLKKIHATKPKKVNDATADKLSNCALTTLAGITGGVTSGQLNDKIQLDKGITASSGDQSQRTWSLNLLQLETLAKSGMAQVTTDKEKNKSLIKDFEDFGEGNAFVVGDAQYYGMLQYLLQLAETEETSNPGATFKVYEHGEPGNQMDDEASLMLAMNTYPNGTRFAVFLYSSTPGQHVGAHWVYAQKFNGDVIFQDYQTNTAAMKGPDSYLNQFPFSPDKGQDKGKSFEKGSFMAYVPTFNGAEPTLTDGKAKLVDAEAVAGIIVGIQDKIQALRPQVEAPGRKMSTNWTPMGTPLTSIPPPSVVEQGFKDVGAKFGVTPVCQFSGGLTKAGVIQIFGAPVHESAKKLSKTVKGSLENFTSDNIKFNNVNSTMPVKQPGQAAGLDTGELPVQSGKDESESDYGEAFAKTYQISAATKEDKIIINAANSAFTDLIHEASHTFEKDTLPMHFREGLAEIFAGSVAQKIQQEHSDDDYEYSYNASYSPYVVGMQELGEIIGLPKLAKLYFDTTSDNFESLLTGAITPLVPPTTTPATPVAETVDKLLNGTFPGAFKEGMAELKSLGTAPPTLTKEEDKFKKEVDNPRKAKFDTYLDKKLKGFEKKYNFTAPSSATDMDKAGLVDTWDSNEVAESRLKILYTQKGEATGPQFVQLMKLIGGHESSISAATGETPEQLRARILPAVPITFGTHYITKPGQNIFVCGETPELGEWNPAKAKPLIWIGEANWRTTISLPATGMSLSYKYLMKEDTEVTWETGGHGKHHNRTLPSDVSSKDYIDTWSLYS